MDAADRTADVAFITIVFCLPNANPVNSQTVRRPSGSFSTDPTQLNYTPVAVGIVVAWIALLWLVWARKHFVGRAS